MSEYDDLLIAWNRWDAHCTRVHAPHDSHVKEPLGCPTTVAMETACQAYANAGGVDCSVMRAEFSEKRRSGLSPEEILGV